MSTGYPTLRKLPVARLPSRYRALTQEAIEAQDARESKFTQARAEKAEAVIESGRRKLRDLFSSSKGHAAPAPSTLLVPMMSASIAFPTVGWLIRSVEVRI